MKIFRIIAGISFCVLGLLSCKKEAVLTFEEECFTKGVQVYDCDDYKIKAATETDRIFVKSKSEIYLISKIDVDKSDKIAPEFTISGNFNGQIINLTKGSVLVLEDANLENNGKSVIFSEKKFELSAKKGTVNTIKATGKPIDEKTGEEEKTGAVRCEKKLEIGGKGTLTIESSFFHGIKADTVEVKGGVNLSIKGTGADGSCINCEVFTVEEGKSFTVNFAGFKHAIKADDYIEIASGTFILADDIQVAFKTESVETDGKTTHHITISGGSLSVASQGLIDGIKCDKEKIYIADGVVKVRG